MNIGQALKICRSAKRLSLKDLGKSAGLSQSYLSMVESGERTPTLQSIEKLAGVLNVPTPILFFLAAEKGELRGIDEETSQRLAATVLNVIRS